jgi:hypothetical protein
LFLITLAPSQVDSLFHFNVGKNQFAVLLQGTGAVPVLGRFNITINASFGKGHVAMHRFQ